MSETLTIRVEEMGGSPPSAPTVPSSGPTVPGSPPPSSPVPSAVPAPEGNAASVAGVAVAAAAVTAAFAATVASVKAWGRTIEDSARELSGFSGEIATARAETQLGRIQGQLNRAQRVGTELAEAERTRARFEGSFDNLQTELLKQSLRITNELAPIINLASVSADGITNFLKTAEDIGLNVAQFMPVLGALLRAAKAIEFLMGEQVNQNEGGRDFDPMTQWFLNQVNDNAFAGGIEPLAPEVD